MLFWILLTIFGPALFADQLGSEQYVVSPQDPRSIEDRLVSVNSDGTPAAFEAPHTSKSVLHAGCFTPILSRRPSLYGDTGDSGRPFSPLECYAMCSSNGIKVAAVNGQHCACSSQVTTVFTRAVSDESCDINCVGEFTSPICGGVNDFWNLYMDYSYEQILSLAVDPWRNIAFKTVAINWAKEDGLAYNQVPVLESHYLFASDVASGKPLVQYHQQEWDGLDIATPVVYAGLRYDLDSSRIVALAVPGKKSPSDAFWYKLVVIAIDTSDASNPVMKTTWTSMYSDPVSRADILTDSDSQNFFVGSIVSGIVALNGLDTYVWSQGYGSVNGDPTTLRSRLIFVDLTALGHVYFTAALDCVVTQLAINPYFGDVAILAPRQGSIQFIAVASVHRDPLTNTLRAKSFWDPSGLNPVYVASVVDTQGLNLLAGVSASLPMQNQSCQGIMLYDSVNGASYTDDRQLLANQPSAKTQLKKGGVPSVICFDIRKQGFFDLWGSSQGTARSVEDGIISAAVAMNLFESDPGFPFSLSRPVMQTCQLSSTGISVIITFDSVTLMGAAPGGAQATGIPTFVDYSTQVVSASPASVCFSNLSLPLLTGATCVFTQSNTLVLSLDRFLSTLSFNNSLCIKPGFLYRNQGSAWSSYAIGCCTVTLPANVAPPNPVLVATPSLTVDVCSDVLLDFSDSDLCGKACLFNWTLVNVVDSSLVLGTGLVMNTPAFLRQTAQGIRNFLSPLNNRGNASAALIGTALLAKNALHYFSVQLTSSWLQKSVFTFAVQKLSVPALSVAIQGNRFLVATRMTGYSLTALGRYSACNSTLFSSASIRYQWSFSNCSVDLSKHPSIVSDQNILFVPPATHLCLSGVAWLDEAVNRIACEKCIVTVSVSSSDNPASQSTQSMSVEIVKSQVMARCFNPDASQVPVGPAFIIDCSNSLDPDDPAVISFQGNFAYSCEFVSGKTTPCFNNNPALDNMQNCQTDRTQPLQVGQGGQLYPQIMFNATQGYCKVSRGVLAVNTNLLFAIGTSFSFGIYISHFDGLRETSKQISVRLVNLPLPPVTLNITGAVAGSSSLYPISKTLQVFATTSLPSSAKNVAYEWTLLTRELNGLFNPSAASSGVAQYIYAAVSTLADCQAQGIAVFTPESPTLTILPYCLSSSTGYSMRMNMTWVQTYNGISTPFWTYAEAIFSTASGAPYGGTFFVQPSDPALTSCNYVQTFTANAWVSEDTPLMYQFGYVVDQSVTAVNSSNVNSLVKFWLTDSAQAMRSVSGLLPCGQKTSNYYITAFVQITSTTGEYTYAFTRVQSRPPSDPLSASASLVIQGSVLIGANPANAFSNYMTAMSLVVSANASLETFTSQITADLSSVKCATSHCGDRLLVFVNALMKTLQGISASWALQQLQLSFVEQNVGRISVSPSDFSSIAQTQTLFNSLSALSASLSDSKPPTTVSFASQRAVPFMASTKKSNRNLQQSGIRDLHSLPNSPGGVITDCGEVYCHLSGVTCVREERMGQHNHLVCCDSKNSLTHCLDPPCWFYGLDCPPEPIPSQAPKKTDSWNDESLLSTQEAEKGPLSDSINLALFTRRTEYVNFASEKKFSSYITSLQADISHVLSNQRLLSEESEALSVNQTALNASRLVARMLSATDAIARNLIKALIKDQPPVVFDTDLFRIYIGKTTNLSSQLPALHFSDRYTVPRSSPDNPTPDNPVTGFSYYYIEYHSNIFSWALNTPISTEATIVTLSVMKANPDIPLIPEPLDEPIRVFADRNLFASAFCNIWDPLSAVTGGGWTGQGAVNDANGCLFKNAGTFGLFLQSEFADPEVSGISDSTSTSVNSIGVKRFFITSLFVYFMLIVGIAVLAAYRLDITTDNPPASVHLEGDGLTSAQHLNDPIAYDHKDSGIRSFIFQTLKNSFVINHVFVWPKSYHPIYTRPQRVLTGSALITGCMTFTCALYSPRTTGVSKDVVAAGFLASFLAYPVFIIFDAIFALRPDASKSLPVKRVQGAKKEIHARNLDLTFGKDLWDSSLKANDDVCPPPPPEENASGFVQRVQQVYEGKSSVEHLKELEIQAEPPRLHPPWVESLCSSIAFSAWTGWTVLSGIVVCLRSMYYDPTILEPAWAISVSIAIFISTSVLETLRCTAITVLAIYKFEKRRSNANAPKKQRKIVSPQIPSPVSARSEISSRESSVSPPLRRIPRTVSRSPIVFPQREISLVRSHSRVLPSRQASRSPTPSPVTEPVRTTLIPIPDPVPASSRADTLLPGRIETVSEHVPNPPPH